MERAFRKAQHKQKAAPPGRRAQIRLQILSLGLRVEVLVVCEVFCSRRYRVGDGLPGNGPEEGRDCDRDVGEYEDREGEEVKEFLYACRADLLPLGDDCDEADQEDRCITFCDCLAQGCDCEENIVARDHRYDGEKEVQDYCRH